MKKLKINYIQSFLQTVGQQQEKPYPSTRDKLSNGVGVQLQVSNLELVKNWIPLIGHLSDRTPIMQQIHVGTQKTNEIQEFCNSYD